MAMAPSLRQARPRRRRGPTRVAGGFMSSIERDVIGIEEHVTEKR